MWDGEIEFHEFAKFISLLSPPLVEKEKGPFRLGNYVL